MNKKRLILALGSAATVAAPIAATISCTAWDQPITGGADLTGASSSVWHGAFRNGGTHALPAVGNAYTVTAGGKKLSYTWTQADTDSKEGKAWIAGGTQSDIINYFARQFESANAGSSAETILNAFGISMHGVKFEAGGDAGGDAAVNVDFTINDVKKTFMAFGHELLRDRTLKAGDIIGVGSQKHTLSQDDIDGFTSLTQAKSLELVGRLVKLNAEQAKVFADTYNAAFEASPHKGQVIDAEAIASSTKTPTVVDTRALPVANAGTMVTYTAYDAQDFSVANDGKTAVADAKINPIKRPSSERVFYVGDLISDKHAKSAPWVVKGHGSMGYHSLFAALKHNDSSEEVIESGVKVVLTVGRFQYTRVLTDADINRYSILTKEYLATGAGVTPDQHDTQVQAASVRWLNAMLGVDETDRKTVEGWLAGAHDSLGMDATASRTKVKEFNVGVLADHHGVVQDGKNAGSSHGFHTLFSMFKHPFGDSKYDKTENIIENDTINYFFTSKSKIYEAKIKVSAAMINKFKDIHGDYSPEFQAGKLVELVINSIVDVKEVSVTESTTKDSDGNDIPVSTPKDVSTTTSAITAAQRLDALKEANGWLTVEGTAHSAGIGHRLSDATKTFKVGVFADHHGAVEFGGGASHGFHTLFGAFKHPMGDAKFDSDDILIPGDKIEFTYNVDSKLFVTEILLTKDIIAAFNKAFDDAKGSVTDLPGELVTQMVNLITTANTKETATLDKTATTAQIDAIYKSSTAAAADMSDLAKFKQTVIDQVNAWLLVTGTAHTGGIATASKAIVKP